MLLRGKPQKLELMDEILRDIDSPLKTEVFEMSYAQVEQAEGLISDLLTPELGKVIADQRNGKLIVYDLPHRLRRIREVISALDQMSRQVFIQAEIIEISLSNDYYRGINWQKTLTAADNLDFCR